MHIVTITIDSRYIAVIYNTIVNTAQQLQWQNFSQTLHLRMTPHCGVFSVNYSKKNDRHIPRAHCTTTMKPVVLSAYLTWRMHLCIFYICDFLLCFYIYVFCNLWRFGNKRIINMNQNSLQPTRFRRNKVNIAVETEPADGLAPVSVSTFWTELISS